jgi:hypothetical protein
MEGEITMRFSKGVILKAVLSLTLALSVFPVNGVRTANAAPPNSVQLNTYGSLPVIVLNLTQSSVDIAISTTSSFYNNSATPFPLAVGLPGVYYAGTGGAASGATPTFSNIANTNAISQSNASLNPLGSLKNNNFTFSSNYDWMSLFTVFPSWTAPAAYTNVQYQTLGNVNNHGAAGGLDQAITGYPTVEAKNATGKGSYTSGSVLNAAQATTTSINLGLRSIPAPGNEAIQYNVTYTATINSGGAGTSGAPPTGLTAASIVHALHDALDMIADCAVLMSGDPLGIIDYVAGVPATIEAIVDNSGGNANTTTNSKYTASSAGINVTASSTINPGFTQTFTPYTGTSAAPYQGDSQSQIYEASSTAANFPLRLQNYVTFTTWRQSPSNTGSDERTAADTLIITIVNNGVYTSNQIQQYINTHPSSSTTSAMRYKPTKEQAQDTLNILTILTALEKNHPEDAKAIVGMFGMRGTYRAIKNNPNALRNLNVELKTIFEKHKTELPAVAPYLAKLVQK